MISDPKFCLVLPLRTLAPYEIFNERQRQYLYSCNDLIFSSSLQEAEKIALAECTGLDQKQINNWFINQRKRHWKPSEDMQLMAMDGHSPHSAALYVERHLMTEGYHLDC